MPQLQRTVGSSFDAQLFEEVESLINGHVGADSAIPDNLDDALLGQEAKNAAESNFQKGQEVANTIATLGWKYIEQLMVDIVNDYDKRAHAAESDAEIIETRRSWRVSERIVGEILRKVESAANVPHPDDLPR